MHLNVGQRDSSIHPLTEDTDILPFLKSKMAKAPGVVMSYTRAPDEGSTPDESMADDASLDAASQDLITAFHAKDVKGVSAALKAAFQILDAMPHEEGEHTNETE